MKPLLLPILILAVAILTAKAEPQSDALVQKLTAVIRENCPDAVIQVTNNLFIAKYDAMMFTLHGENMTGEISAKTNQKEGPNYKGFVLTIGVERGKYEGQAIVPQELHGPYFPTFINAIPTEDGKDHYWITFSYGSRLDPKIKQAIFDAMPKSKFQQSGR